MNTQTNTPNDRRIKQRANTEPQKQAHHGTGNNQGLLTQTRRQVSGPLAQVQTEAPPAAVQLVTTVTGVVDGGAHLERFPSPQAVLRNTRVHAVGDVCNGTVGSFFTDQPVLNSTNSIKLDRLDLLIYEHILKENMHVYIHSSRTSRPFSRRKDWERERERERERSRQAGRQAGRQAKINK